MTTPSDETITENNHLVAITELAKNIIEGTYEVFSLYQENNLILNKPEEFIRLYCHWLAYVVGWKITGNTEHLFNLIPNTIQEQLENGKNLYQVINLPQKKQDASIENLVKDYGLIIVPILKMMRFISESIKQTGTVTSSLTAEERSQLEKILTPTVEEIFNKKFQTALEAINSLNINNPLIFLLEHFSIMVGWLAGFFAQLTNQPTAVFLKTGLIYFEEIPSLKSVN